MGIAISKNTKQGEVLTRQGLMISGWVASNTKVDKLSRNNIRIYMTDILDGVFNVDSPDDLTFDDDRIFKFCNLLMIHPLQFQKAVIISMGADDEEPLPDGVIKSDSLPIFISSERRMIDVMIPTRVEREWGTDVIEKPGKKEVIVNTYEFNIKMAIIPHRVEFTYEDGNCSIFIVTDLHDEIHITVPRKLMRGVVKNVLGKYEKSSKGKSMWIDPDVENVNEFTVYPPEDSERVFFNVLKKLAKKKIVTAPVRDMEYSTGAIKFKRGSRF